MADIFEETTALCGKPKKVSNWLMVETMRLLKEHNMESEDITFTPDNHGHALANTGNTDLVFMALIIKD